MYKTVRQGDASLRYTILPQIDEFYGHDVSSVRGSSQVKGHRCTSEDRIWLSWSRVRWSRMIVIIITCFVMATCIFHTMNRGSCAVNASQSTASVTNRVAITDETLDDDDAEETTVASTATTIVSSTLGASSMLTDNRLLDLTSGTSTLSPTTADMEIGTFQLTITDAASTSHQEADATAHSSTTGRISTSTSSPMDAEAESTDISGASIVEAPPNNIVKILQKLKMMKMPRVTLKLRMNDIIPQMYMKAGIASYKKGKITTSVLAQGLSLEGLIFKTPEGTIKPWRDTWSYYDDSDVSQPKNSPWRGVSLAAIILLLIYVTIRWKLGRMYSYSSEKTCDDGNRLLRERWYQMEKLTKCGMHPVELNDVERQDETHSTLLDAPNRDHEDKA